MSTPGTRAARNPFRRGWWTGSCWPSASLNGMPVGVTTGEWIEPDLQQRLRLIREWTQPDYASVNLSEPGAVEVMQALLAARVGIEAGVWTVEDAELLVAADCPVA